MRKVPLELIVAVYLVLWLPNIALTRALTMRPAGGLDRPFTGLEILPILTCMTTLAMWAFIGFSGWWRSAYTVKVLGVPLPVPTSWRLLSAIAGGMLAVTTPLSFTFPGVSVPFIQVLMKGGVLAIAPLVDLLTGRKVNWFSWVALGLVLLALSVTVAGRGSLELPWLCWGVIGFYVLAYFLRLGSMSKAAKTDDPASLRRFLVEEQVAAWPISIVALTALMLFVRAPAIDQVRWGMSHLWTNPALPLLAIVGTITAMLGWLSMLILLDRRENTFCVPLERSASVLGGLAATYLLTFILGLPAPTPAELQGAGLLVLAVVILSIGPRLGRPRPAAPAGEPA
jgi:hypothetical protein